MEIEFRGLATIGKEIMLYGDLLHYGSYTSIRYDVGSNLEPKYIEVPVDPNSTGQYTGLRDKNGVKIYKGDILQTDTIRQYVDFNESLACFGVRNINGGCTMSIDSNWEVIGNIHQNKELLV
jgi:uncharacterized phage protein (TIGR01671 family)